MVLGKLLCIQHGCKETVCLNFVLQYLKAHFLDIARINLPKLDNSSISAFRSEGVEEHNEDMFPLVLKASQRTSV